MRAEAGTIAKVSGTRTATAMVAVSPGSEPTMVPAATPPRANATLNGVSAAAKYPMSGSMPGSLLAGRRSTSCCEMRARALSSARGQREFQSPLLDDAGFLSCFGVGFVHVRHEGVHVLIADVEHGHAIVLQPLAELRILIDLADHVGDLFAQFLRRRLRHRDEAEGAGRTLVAELLEGRHVRAQGMALVHGDGHHADLVLEVGRASGRERGGQNVWI